MNNILRFGAMILLMCIITAPTVKQPPAVVKPIFKKTYPRIGRGWAFLNDSTVVIEHRDTIDCFITHFREDSTWLVYDSLNNMTRLSAQGFERLEPFRKLGSKKISNL